MSLKIRTMMQGDRTAKEHVQDFKKAAIEAGYEGFPLIVEFKQKIKADRAGNFPRIRQELLEYGITPGHLIIYTDKEATRIEARHNQDQ